MVTPGLPLGNPKRSILSYNQIVQKKRLLGIRITIMYEVKNSNTIDNT